MDNSKSLMFSKIILGVVILGLFFSVVVFMQNKMTGNVLLDIKTTYLSNETLQGDLALSLKAGELVPTDSVVRLNVGGEDYDFVLSDLVSESVVNGDFYAEGILLEGSGEGFGVIGEAEIYPEVDFVLEVIDSGDSKEKKEKKEKSGGDSGAVVGESVVEENVTVEEESKVTEEVEEEVVEEVEAGEEVEIVEEEPEGEQEVEEEVEIVEESGESSEESGGSILTGGVVAELSSEVSGSVSAEEVYIYELEDGQTVELVSSSEDVEISVEGNTVTVTTIYSEIGQGFGEDYLGDVELRLEVDLTSLEVMAVEGDLIVSLVYGETEIVSVESVLDVENPEQEASSGEIEVEVDVEESNFTEVNVTVNETVVDVNETIFTEEELATLMIKTGSTKVDITKAEVVDGRLIIRFKIGSYWLENSYAYSEGDDISEQIELDRVRWVKSLIKELSDSEPESESVEGFVGEYEL